MYCSDGAPSSVEQTRNARQSNAHALGPGAIALHGNATTERPRCVLRYVPPFVRATATWRDEREGSNHV